MISRHSPIALAYTRHLVVPLMSLAASLACAGAAGDDPEPSPPTQAVTSPADPQESVVEKRIQTTRCCTDCAGGVPAICLQCSGNCTAIDLESLTCSTTNETLQCPPPPLHCPEFSLFVPNVITPNDDGYNDLWMVMDANRGTASIFASSYKLTIVNRWGGVIYSVSGAPKQGFPAYYQGGEISWNGRVDNQGDLVSTGDYYYSLVLTRCDGSSKLFKGVISVLY